MENWEYAELYCVLNVDLEVKEYFKFVKLEYNYNKKYMKNIIIKEIYFLNQEMHYLLFL